jgi:hypothetical protein
LNERLDSHDFFVEVRGSLDNYKYTDVSATVVVVKQVATVAKVATVTGSLYVVDPMNEIIVRSKGKNVLN